jgi:hypothetical protein
VPAGGANVLFQMFDLHNLKVKDSFSGPLLYLLTALQCGMSTEQYCI